MRLLAGLLAVCAAYLLGWSRGYWSRGYPVGDEPEPDIQPLDPRLWRTSPHLVTIHGRTQ